MKRLIVALSILVLSAGCSFDILTFGSGGVRGVIKTVDGGGSWSVKNLISGTNSDIGGLDVSEMAFSVNDPSKLYISAYNSGLWYSEDSAESWKPILTRIAVNDFYVSRGDQNKIFAVGSYASHGKVVRTLDGGASWEEIFNEASYKNAVNSIAVNPANENEIYIGLNSGTFLRSNDAGSNWFVVYNFEDQILRLRFNPLNNGFYAIVRAKGIGKSTDQGKSWGFVKPSDVERVNRVAFDDQNPSVMYLTSANGIFKTTDEGKNWLFLNLPLKDNAQQPRGVASSKGGMLAYTSVGSTMYRTIDGGQSWQTQLLPTNRTANKILVDPALSQIVYVGISAQ